jgi:hypothetical protein
MMTITLDSASRKKLVLAKQLYQQSLRQSAAHTSIMDRIMAVIGFDLAIETALKAAAIAMDPALKPKALFKTLLCRIRAKSADHPLTHHGAHLWRTRSTWRSCGGG